MKSFKDPAMEGNAIILQVLICAYGKDGIKRLKKSDRPKMSGVEYLVSWQTGGADPDYASSLLDRDDFRIYATDTNGISVNRNIALSKATAPLLLISDDDADYTEEGLHNVIRGFEDNPEVDIIAFRYGSAFSHKRYPEFSFSLANPPKGYYVSSIEIAFRRKSVKGQIWFNENFGIGAMFPSGEEDIFLADCLDHGLRGIYVPLTIATHDGTTTSARNLTLPSRPQTKGAIFMRLHPKDWALRMIVNGAREIPLWRKGRVPSPLSYCRNWLKGIDMARKNKVFPTPDYSNTYMSHE